MRKREISKEILNYLFLGGALFFVLSFPGGTRRFLKQLPREFKKYKKLQLQHALSYLKSRGEIKYIEKDNSTVAIEITGNGKKELQKINFDNLCLEQPLVWDKKWRLVIFDIPEKRKIAREALRCKLKEMNFIKIQHSVWAVPFPCDKEINLIKTVFNLSSAWVNVIVAENLGDQEYKSREYYDLI